MPSTGVDWLRRLAVSTRRKEGRSCSMPAGSAFGLANAHMQSRFAWIRVDLLCAVFLPERWQWETLRLEAAIDKSLKASCLENK